VTEIGYHSQVKKPATHHKVTENFELCSVQRMFFKQYVQKEDGPDSLLGPKKDIL